MINIITQIWMDGESLFMELGSEPPTQRGAFTRVEIHPMHIPNEARDFKPFIGAELHKIVVEDTSWIIVKTSKGDLLMGQVGTDDVEVSFG